MFRGVRALRLHSGGKGWLDTPRHPLFKNPMNYPLISFLSICCLLLLGQASADRVLLKNGEIHEGKVIFEDDTHCVLEIQVTKTIKDEKKFLKSDIRSIKKAVPDAEEFEKISGLVPVPDLLEVADYEARITKVEAFIKNFPQSAKIPAAKKILDDLTTELSMISLGGLKFSGKMISAEEYLANAYTYDQTIAIQKMNRDIRLRNYLGALRLFADYESKFADGATRQQLLPKIQQVLVAYQMSLKESMMGYDALVKTREIGMSRMSNLDRMNSERALAEEKASLTARFEREKMTKNAWVTPDAYHKDSLTEALRQVENEIKRLNTPPKNKALIKSLEDTYREVWEKLPNATAEEQKDIMGILKRDRMPEYYMTKLQARVKSE